MPSFDQTWHDIHFTSRDGLRLYARHYPAAGGARGRPVVCLAGLTRNSKDFHDLAEALAGHAACPRDVYCLDYRGRGRSQYDPDWKNYTVLVEMQDVLDFMTLRGLHDAAVIGTSRGGLIAMVMAVVRPAALGAVVLNDIGPVLEREGIARITAYVGKVPLPKDWTEATELVRGMNKRFFTDIPDEQWEEVARQMFSDENGLPTPGYDAKLGNAVSLLNGPLPELWPQFAALARVPVLVLRGETSDILSRKTLDEMRLRHPRLESFIIRGQGHAPLLKDAQSITTVANFLDHAEAAPGATHVPALAAGR